MRKTLIALLVSSALLSAGGAYSAEHNFQAVTFGQSTDLNFSTNVLPDKVGVNYTYLSDGTIASAEPMPLKTPIRLESRGGKIGNSHDGLTFYYTKLPIDQNFVLEATVKIEQFGPENGAKPAAQEGCGLLVRDVLGKPRLEEVQPGIEEFPAASNMVMTAAMTQDKKDHNHVKIVQMDRNGITVPWGNAGGVMLRSDVAQGLDLEKADTFKLRLERTDRGIISAYAPEGSDQWVEHEAVGADRLGVIDHDNYYVGFFASRNANMSVLDYKLTTSKADTEQTGFTPQAQPLVIERGSADVFAEGGKYSFKFRANEDGSLKLEVNGKAVAEQDLTAGTMAAIPVDAVDGAHLNYTFTGKDGQSRSDSVTLKAVKTASLTELYAAPKSADKADGSKDAPFDLTTALSLVQDGGSVVLADGEYPLTTISADLSGAENALKTVKGSDKTVFAGLDLNASYIKLTGLTVTVKPLNVAGSYNVLDYVTAHHCDDTGIWVASPADVGRALWASHNQILNCTSYQNQDPGNINADGFAVKMRVGEGNKIVNALSWGNADDGYDLFNKIEDGPNGAVVIEDSVAMFNSNNGFKQGGEGLPVNHTVVNCIAYQNGMDGFTDNFNPGSITVKDNISIDNARFNYLYRKGPFVEDVKDQGQFENNVSVRTKDGIYPDVVNGNIIGDGNIFLDSTKANDQGYQVVSHQKGEVPARAEDGSLDRSFFVTKP